ncbi:hypothetical protein GCM10010199_60300 [Dactylosporangium roseum]
MRVEGGTGHRCAQGHLRGHLATRAAQDPVAHGRVDGGSGLLEGGRDVGEVEQWSERITWHQQTVSCRYCEQCLEKTGAAKEPLGAEASLLVTPPN